MKRGRGSGGRAGKRRRKGGAIPTPATPGGAPFADAAPEEHGWDAAGAAATLNHWNMLPEELRGCALVLGVPTSVAQLATGATPAPPQLRDDKREALLRYARHLGVRAVHLRSEDDAAAEEGLRALDEAFEASREALDAGAGGRQEGEPPASGERKDVWLGALVRTVRWACAAEDGKEGARRAKKMAEFFKKFQAEFKLLAEVG